jgi:hypothetical protein
MRSPLISHCFAVTPPPAKGKGVPTDHPPLTHTPSPAHVADYLLALALSKLLRFAPSNPNRPRLCLAVVTPADYYGPRVRAGGEEPGTADIEDA